MLQQIEAYRASDLHLKSDPETGLRAVIAIHSTRLGPALGGCRCLPYASDSEAVTDALRLARAMSYKAALSGLSQGGGKAVIMAPAPPFDRQRLFHSFGRFVDSLGGHYITAKDSGTELDDLDEVAKTTDHVSGTGRDGMDPSPATARGLFRGLQAAVEQVFGHAQLRGLHFAVQGLGAVGASLARALADAGAQLTLSDVDEAKAGQWAEALAAEAVPAEAIYEVDADVLVPCALGGVIDEASLARLQCRLVAGAANNQLASPAMDEALQRRGIAYVPDYVINAGGLIQVALGHQGVTGEAVAAKIDAIGETTRRILEAAREADRPTEAVANEMAEAILYSS